MTLAFARTLHFCMRLSDWFNIRNEQFRAPDDFQSTFYTLGENGVLDEELAQRLAPIVGLRNRLVHRYESVDTILLLTMIRKECTDITEYMKQIRARYKDMASG